MRTRVGVRPFDSFSSVDELKRDSLLFDQIAISELSMNLGYAEEYAETDEDRRRIAELQYLRENNVVFEPSVNINDPRLVDTPVYRDYKRSLAALTGVLESMLSGNAPADGGITFFSLGPGLSTTEINTRLDAALLSLQPNIEAFPVLQGSIGSLDGKDAPKADVLQVVLTALPVPSPDTSWERVLEVRNDTDVRHKFTRLREWISETARSQLPPIEVAEKLEALIAQYREAMAVYDLKVHATTLETVVVTVAELAEDLVKFKWGKLAQGLFTLRHRRIALMESELKAPGREVAYVDVVERAFSKSPHA